MSTNLTTKLSKEDEELYNYSSSMSILCKDSITASKTVSNPFSSAEEKQIATVLLRHSSDALRKQYVALFETQKTKYLKSLSMTKSDRLELLNWWKEQFSQIALDLHKSLDLIEETTNATNNEEDILSVFSNKEYKNYKMVNGFATLGIYPGCDIKCGSSRLHAVCVKRDDTLFIIDVGSYFGIQTYYREDKLPCQNSNPDSRLVLQFKWNTHFILQMGYVTVEFFKN
jgi:hypothetical protein